MNDEKTKKLDQATNEAAEEMANEQPTEMTEEVVDTPVNEQGEARTQEQTDEVTGEPNEELIKEPIEASNEAPIEEPTKEAIKAPIEESAKEPNEELIKAPIEEPAKEPNEESIKEPLQPTSQNQKAPIDEPQVGFANAVLQGVNKEVPEEIKKWNWGAFSLNILWGIGNKTYLPLLCLIPVFNLVWVFICGFKGNEWAWRDGDYTDIETFKKVQKTWSRAGVAMFIIQIGIIVLHLGIIVFFLYSLLSYRHSIIQDFYNYEPYRYDGFYY